MLLRSIRSRLLGLVLATVVPFTALIGGGLWSQWRNDRAAAIDRALAEARLLAAQVDDHIGNLDNLMAGLARAVSTDAADAVANDALLRQVKSELPDFISNVLLFSRDGTNIGLAVDGRGERIYAGDRSYFRQVLNGQRLSISEVIRARVTDEWVTVVARPVEDQAGRLQAVLVIGTRLEHFQDALRTQGFPAGSVVRIVDEKGIVVAQSVNGPNWIGRDLSKSESVARHIAAKEASEVVVWSDNVERITGSSTAHRVPWLVSVGLPTDTAFAVVASRLRWGAFFSAGAVFTAFTIAWMLSGRIVRPLQQLGKDALVLAAGKLCHRTSIRTRDEVGDLADTFDLMAQSLERRQEESLRAADEVRQVKDTLAAVIDASPVAIVCSDPNRHIVLWSRAAEQIFGYTADEVIGHVIKTVPPEEMARSESVFHRALSGEAFRDVQSKRLRKDGSPVDIQTTATPLHHPDGTVRGVVWVHEDITNRMRAEEQMRRLAHYDRLTGLPNRLSLQ